MGEFKGIYYEVRMKPNSTGEGEHPALYFKVPYWRPIPNNLLASWVATIEILEEEKYNEMVDAIGGRILEVLIEKARTFLYNEVKTLFKGVKNET